MIASVPSLDLTIVATPQTDLERLVQEQIRSSLRRRNLWSLRGLAQLGQTDGMSLVNQRIDVRVPTPSEYARRQQDQPKTKTPTLSSVATRLEPKSLRGAFERDAEVEQLARLLAADPPRSVLMVGPFGVGKTAIFHQWVRRKSSFGWDRSMASVACWSTDGSRLISGQCGFGMWQQQCLQMADEAKRYPSVIHLGNLVELSESGRLRGSGGCGALLAPRLADGSLKAVLECTPEQLTRIGRVEPGLVQALTILRIEEPSPEQTRSILLESAAAWRPWDITEELKRRRQRRKGVRSKRPARSAVIEPEALQVLDRLHRRFRTDSSAPGRPLAFFYSLMSQLGPNQRLDVPTVMEAFGRQTGLPRFLIDADVRPDLDSIQQQLASQVLGQPSVIQTLVDMIATLAADLSRGDRPLASMMLIGPTGVGKTETAKALARLIYSDVSRLIRIDMSELSTPTAAARLIGDATHPEGVLTSAVRAQPFSLILLDEFEKAHWSVFDLLLQVLGEGRLTDGRGRLADFRNSIVLMTSNLGVDTFRAAPLGLADTQQQDRYRNHFQRQVRDFLRPEMFNRIDRILTYAPLEESTVQRIARLRLEELQRRAGWHSRGERLDVDQAALASLSRSGFQPQYGARPLTREIERTVAVPLAEAICKTGPLGKLTAEVNIRHGENQGESVSVSVSSRGAQQQRSDETVVAAIERMTTLRRRSQSLHRCDALRRLRNQYTMVSRKWKTWMRRAKDPIQREKIRYGPLGVDRRQTRQRIAAAEKLCDDIIAAEAELLARYYQGKPIDPPAASEQIEALRARLWNKLCELLGDETGDSGRITLVMTAADFSPAIFLLEAYQRLARSRGWNLQVHALLGRQQNNSVDRIIDCPGWSEKPAFRMRTNDEPVESAEEDRDRHEQSPPSLAAYRLVRSRALADPPAGTLGLMLTYRGANAGLMMSGEAGVHTIHRPQKPNFGCSILIDTHRGMPMEYRPPTWLPRRRFQVTGQPRRAYDVETDLVTDLTDKARTIKMNREGKWLETLIERQTERRIWAELDEA